LYAWQKYSSCCTVWRCPTLVFRDTVRVVKIKNSLTELLWKNPNEDRSEANERMYGSARGERQ